MTKQEAIAKAKTSWWKTATSVEIVRGNTIESGGRLCSDFHVFHVACEAVLRRPIWTHEFAFESVWAALERAAGPSYTARYLAAVPGMVERCKR
jgi:hypothetical protein